MEKEVNIHQLRQVLLKLSSELQISFLQKRRQSQSHHQNPLDQLREVVLKITQRERDLHSAIGISNILIDLNEELNQKIDQLTRSKSRKKEEIGMLKNQLAYTKEDLYQSQEKYTQLTRSLVASQQENLVLTSENKRFQIEFSRIIGNSEKTQQFNKIQYRHQLENLNKKFQQQFLNMKNLKEKVWVEKIDLQNKISEMVQNYKELEQENKRLNQVIQKLSIQQTNSNNLLNQFENRQSQLTLSMTQLQKTHKLALKKIELLQDELHLKENSAIFTSTKQESTDLSLMDQLKSLDFDQNYFKPLPVLEMISDLGKICIKSRIDSQRKDPCEDYFILATQSVKVNSPFMDAICTVSPQMLYKKAILLEVPFHKWYNWIENELNAAYIDMLYKKGVLMKKQKSQKSLKVRQSQQFMRSIKKLFYKN